MGTNNKQYILEGRKWDVIESVDGYFSGEKMELSYKERQ